MRNIVRMRTFRHFKRAIHNRPFAVYALVRVRKIVRMRTFSYFKRVSPIVRPQNPVSPLEAAPQRNCPQSRTPSHPRRLPCGIRTHAPLIGHKLTNEGDEKQRACGCRRGEPPGAGMRTTEQRGRMSQGPGHLPPP
ncbi:hypothetical protein NDU88_011276 [Pleurodeles waltl]|uniref:Uncharacterized protein n=1 Tax=Pleurodeles waltl TaxID=8319 RepID=A0AAV7S387_PLEWA|nr:hypothetical protein NDU88_011276 [Pleurodeles waltl]